ncbi:hypothetical protein ACTXI0_11545 [Arthrobacter rhombi]|uniref:hypothetical protein n=1 Tax=Arthrobacter rhombi TaxID=71253 RepID=UPI003FD645F3
MDGIFSHAEPTPDPGSDGGRPRLQPVAACVTVAMECEQAYEGFVDYLHLWWPLGTVGTMGPGSHLGIEDGLLIEESEEGERRQWGSVRHAEPPVRSEASERSHGRLEWDFILGYEQEAPTHVAIDFEETGTGATDVRVTHDGWAPGPEGEGQHEVAEAWPEILGYYQRFMGGAA